MYDVLRYGCGRLLIRTAATAPTAIHRALQRATLAVCFWIVYFETHLLEQGSPLTSTRTAKYPYKIIFYASSWTITHCLFGSVVTVGTTVHIQFFLFSDLLDREESVFPHLNSFCHITHRGIF